MSTSRVGVRISREVPPARLTKLARQAEQAGLDELWVVEDCFYAGGIATAATVLAATETIPVGIGVLPAVARNPAIAAMELATLAELYPGRLIAGIGHGVPSWMRQIGAYPASPLTALEETLTAIRRLLAGERLSMDGKYVRLDEVELDYPPAVVPPVLAGVRGPKSLALSGRAADGTVLAEPAAPEYVRAARATIDADPHTVATYNWLALDQDPDRARDRVRKTLADSLKPSTAEHLRPMPFGEEILALIDESTGADELAARLRPEWIDQLTVSGDLAGCAERVRRLHEAGSASVILLPLPDEPEEDGIAAAGEVAAELRRTSR
ncbi:LLM class flavin-dependent oxidoreductase [Amycolatopsis sp. NPDC059021]|uniref:LLM class flavin-dependent oxidoreductase n=1 Tax=Amycolatopsis sp. NPDC059021 TaxID=3346704 RepID=UPI00366A805C